MVRPQKPLCNKAVRIEESTGHGAGLLQGVGSNKNLLLPPIMPGERVVPNIPKHMKLQVLTSNHETELWPAEPEHEANPHAVMKWATLSLENAVSPLGAPGAELETRRKPHFANTGTTYYFNVAYVEHSSDE